VDVGDGDLAYGVAELQDGSGDIVVVGQVTSGNPTTRQGWIARYDSNLNLQWSQTVPNPNGDLWFRGVTYVNITQTIAVVGTSFSPGSTEHDLVVYNYDADNGTVSWSNTVSLGTANVEGYAVADCLDVLVVVGRAENGAVGYDGVLAYFDALTGMMYGVPEMYDVGGGDDALHAAACDVFNTNILVVAGNDGNGNVWVQAHSPMTPPIWAVTPSLGGSATAWDVGIYTGQDPNYVRVVGEVGLPSDVWIGTYDLSSGTQMASVTYDGTDMLGDMGLGLALTPNGDYVVAGGEGTNATSFDILVQRRNASDNVLWTQLFDGPTSGTDEGQDVAYLTWDNGNFVVVGRKEVGVDTSDLWIAKVRP